MSTHVCRLPGSISGSCSASLEPNPDSKTYRTLSSARLRWDRRGNLATTSASLRYWNSARQRYCRQLVRYRKTLASLPTRSPSQQPRPARKAGFSTFENDCGRETDCLLEGDGFEPSVPPREKPTSSPVETRSLEPPRGGDGMSAPTGKGQCVQQRQQWRRAGTAHFADQPFGGCACPPSGRVSRWPQPALFAQYSQVRQVSTE